MFFLAVGVLLFVQTVALDYVKVTEDSTGVWWFSHGKKRFLTLGVNHVNNGGPDDGVGGRESSQCQKRTGNKLCGDTLSFAEKLGFAPYFNSTMAKWGSQEKWAAGTAERLASYGFNTLGGWSCTLAEKAAAARGMYYAHLLDIGTTWLSHNKGNCFQHDVWSQGFVDQATDVAQKQIVPRANDTMLLGWQLDNEVAWILCGFKTYLALPTEGSTEAVKFLQQKYHTLAAFNKAWNIDATSWDKPELLKQISTNSHLNKTAYNADDSEWQGAVGRQYFKTVHTVIRKYDSNHLILGIRGMYLFSDWLLNACKDYIDVFDIHWYKNEPPMSTAAHVHQVTGKPVMIGEFSFTAYDGNVPNTHGARSCTTQPHCPPGYPWTTQNQRASAFESYVKTLVSAPYALGYHWWQLMDEPWGGRWPDGEDSNYGVVHIDDDGYGVLLNKMANVNAMLTKLHGNSKRN